MIPSEIQISAASDHGYPSLQALALLGAPLPDNVGQSLTVAIATSRKQIATAPKRILSGPRGGPMAGPAKASAKPQAVTQLVPSEIRK